MNRPEIQKIGFIIDPIEKLNPQKDSSLLMMQAALNLNLPVYWSSADSIFSEDGEVYGEWTLFRSAIPINKMALNEFSAIFLREEPPVDQDFIELTYLYELAEKPIFFNPPRAIRDVSEKIATLHYPEFIPHQQVTRHVEHLMDFIKRKNQAIIKPIGLFGSSEVMRVSKDEHELKEKLYEMTRNESRLVVCQEFLEGVSKGDRRIFLVHGEIMGVFDSVPACGDYRGSGRFGAHFQKAVASTREIEICQQLKGDILSKDLYFVGLDFVEEKLTEINVTCVGGVWNMNHVYGIQFEIGLMKSLLTPFFSILWNK